MLDNHNLSAIVILNREQKLPQQEGKRMLEVEVIDKYVEMFRAGKITGSELAELLLAKAGR